MGLPPSEWRQCIEDILADGEWHELEHVIREASKKVPPGKAFRHSERQRIRQREDGIERTRGDRSDAIRTGARGIVVQTLNTAKRSRRAEYKTIENKKWIRSPRAAASIALALADDTVIIPKNHEESARELLDELEQQLIFWRRAFNMLGGNKDVRDAIIGDDPIARIEELLKRNGRKI